MTDVMSPSDNPLRHSASSTGIDLSPPSRRAKARRSTDPPNVLKSAPLGISPPRLTNDAYMARRASLDVQNDSSADDSSPTSKTQLSKPTRPLALISQSSVSPTTSPRDAESAMTPRSRNLATAGACLKALLSSVTRDSNKSAPKTARAAQDKSESAPHVKSLPTTPRRDQLSRDATLLAALQPNDNDDSDDRSSDFDSASTESGSAVVVPPTFVKAISGASTQFGASATIEFDTPGKAPIVRVRSHSSVDELKKRLVDDALFKSMHNARRVGGGSLTSSSEKSPESARHVRASKQALKPMPTTDTYTLIDYNVNPMGLGQWQRFVVPNDKIDYNTRKCLERAVRSDANMYRTCNCGAKECVTQHANPDMRDKFGAIFMIDPTLKINTTERRKIYAEFMHSTVVKASGAWTIYREFDANNTSFVDTPVTFYYRFKMFV